jgi:hypothetical protein
VSAPKPSEQWEDLRRSIIAGIILIDEETPWQGTEPEWWLEMMEVQSAVRAARLKRRRENQP